MNEDTQPLWEIVAVDRNLTDKQINDMRLESDRIVTVRNIDDNETLWRMAITDIFGIDGNSLDYDKELGYSFFGGRIQHDGKTMGSIFYEIHPQSTSFPLAEMGNDEKYYIVNGNAKRVTVSTAFIDYYYGDGRYVRAYAYFDKNTGGMMLHAFDAFKDIHMPMEVREPKTLKYALMYMADQINYDTMNEHLIDAGYHSSFKYKDGIRYITISPFKNNWTT